jgi:hypothetical protein
MKGLIVACRVYVLFLAVFGFFFGQLFFASFKVGATMAGLSGIVVGFMGAKLTLEGISGAVLVVGLCVLGLVGVGIDAFEYYTKHNIPANDFGWFLIAPYCAALMVLGIPATQKIAGHTA